MSGDYAEVGMTAKGVTGHHHGQSLWLSRTDHLAKVTHFASDDMPIKEQQSRKRLGLRGGAGISRPDLPAMFREMTCSEKNISNHASRSKSSAGKTPDAGWFPVRI
jgi:hypothetical protein